STPPQSGGGSAIFPSVTRRSATCWWPPGKRGMSYFAQTPLGSCAYNTFSILPANGRNAHENQLGSRRKTLSVDRSGWSGCRYVAALVRFRLHEPEYGRKIGEHEF